MGRPLTAVRSLWADTAPAPVPHPPLTGDRTVDVAVVGGGFTGLWTAYYLKRADPGLDIAVIEREFAGFGASGRNGGWLSAEFAGSRERYARASGRDIGDLLWYEALALWKSAIFLEGSYGRLLNGTTDDPFFAGLEAGVPELAARAWELAQRAGATR